MKTKDLIALLQATDPSGELECVVTDNEAIYDTQVLPAYYDGDLQIIHFEPGSDRATSAQLVRVGEKVRLYSMSVESAVFGYRERNAGRDLPVECEPSRLPTVERWRENAARALSAFEAS